MSSMRTIREPGWLSPDEVAVSTTPGSRARKARRRRHRLDRPNHNIERKCSADGGKELRRIPND